MSAPLRYGFVGLGGIARTMAADLALVPEVGVLHAVGSRSQDKADEFARAFAVQRSYGSYEALVADPEVDVVYVATPHAQHLEPARAALRAGKHVLVEKPATCHPDDTRALIEEARARGLFLMEAMWTRMNPLVRKAKELIDAGAIGRVRHVDAHLAVGRDFPDDHRMVAPELGGGAIWDLGVYPAHLIDHLVGAPSSVVASGNRGRTGVDTHSVAQLTLPVADGPDATASVLVSFEALSRHFDVYGTRGVLRLPHLIAPREMVLETGPHDAPVRETFVTDLPGRGYTFQLQEAARCVAAGLVESPLVPWRDTEAVAAMLEAWHAAVMTGERS